MPDPIQPIGNNIRLIKTDGTATDFFIRWAQQRQIDISGGITAAQAQQLIEDWAAVREIIVGAGLSGGGPLSSDVTISLGTVLLAYASGDTPSAFTLGIIDSVDAAAWRTAIGAGTGGGSVTSVDGGSSASGFTISGGPITATGTLTFNISNTANARTSLGLAIGTDVQAYSVKLAAYAGGDMPSAFTLGIVDSVDAAAWRAAIGAGTSTVTPAAVTKADDTNVTMTLGGTPATAALQAFSMTLGWTGTLSVARGGTGSGTAAGARTNLGLDAGGAGDIWVEKAGDTMTGNLNINVATSTAAFDIRGGTGSSQLVTSYLSGVSAPFIEVRHARGNNSAAPVILQTGDLPGSIIFSGYNGSGFTRLAQFNTVLTDPSPSSTAMGTRISILLIPNGSVASDEIMGISWEAGLKLLSGNVVVDENRIFRLRQYTVATLPTAGTAGRFAAVTDALAPTYGATVVGGGAINTPVYDNAANWTCR